MAIFDVEEYVPITIGSNIQALKAQSALLRANDSLSKTFERLSSGQRINSASDDPAGLAVADSLRVQTRLSNKAIQNISDGISAINIVSATLDNQTQIITRLQELAEQAANGTLSSTQRGALQTEYQALIDEYGRIGDTTKFNNTNLLLSGRGSHPTSLQLQTGIDGSLNAQLSISGANTGSFSGEVYYDTSGDSIAFAPAISLDDLALNGNRFFHAQITDTRNIKHDAIIFLNEDGSGGMYSHLFFKSNETASGGSSETYTSLGATNTASSIYFDSSGKVIGSGVIQSTNQGGLANGATFSLSIDLSGLTGRSFNSSSQSLPPSTVINFTGVETEKRGRAALDRLTEKLNELNTIKGRYGAAQSRLNIQANLQRVNSENYASAESRIRDTDIAQEAGTLMRQQILQQASVAILGQANQIPALVLQLLGGP